MNLTKTITLLIITVLISIILTTMIYNHLTTYKIQEFEMQLTVGDTVGFNAGTDKLYFGETPPGKATTTRYIVLNNDYTKPLKISFCAKGDIAKWVSIQKSVIIQPNKTLQIPITATPSQDAKQGNYTGTLKVVFKHLFKQ